MQSTKKSTTRPAATGPLANAFSSHFLTRARRRDRALHEEGSSLDTRSLAAGPWDVESLDARCGRVHAVVRRGEPVGDGGGAVALCRSYPEALQLAAVLPSLGVENRLEVGERAKPLGLALHDGRRFVAHLAPNGPAAAPAVAAHLHAARHLAADLGSLALLHRSLGSEALVLLGRELMRRMG
jgi:hypothetical protein